MEGIVYEMVGLDRIGHGSRIKLVATKQIRCERPRLLIHSVDVVVECVAAMKNRTRNDCPVERLMKMKWWGWVGLWLLFSITLERNWSVSHVVGLCVLAWIFWCRAWQR